EAGEGAEGHIFLLGATGPSLPQPGTGQPDQPPEVALPQPLGRGSIAQLQLSDPTANRSRLERHHHLPVRDVTQRDPETFAGGQWPDYKAGCSPFPSILDQLRGWATSRALPC